MNQGVFESSPVQQMMAGNPNWWNINSMRPPPQQPSPFLPSASSLFPQFTPSSSLPLTSLINDNQDLPESWSQLLLGGLVEEEDRSELSHFQTKKAENWEEQAFYPSPIVPSTDVKQEVSEVGYPYGNINEEYQVSKPSWSPQLMTASSPMSCVTSFSSNMLDFSSKSDGRHQQTDHSSECNSTATGGACKKARVQPSTTQSTFKVRKEKLGDRITALHQLVSPFGKTDTASVLLEAIGYIRFLQSQIEALSSPYLGTGSGNIRQQQSLLNDTCMKRRRAVEMDSEDEPKKDLRSRGLCLVPVSCTLQVGSDNGADYWAPSLGAGFH